MLRRLSSPFGMSTALLGLGIFAASCSSSPDYVERQVIANSDNSLETPDWLLKANPMSEEGGDVVYTYRMYLDGSARPDACLNMARTQATGEMLRYIKTAVTTSGQVEDMGASGDPSFSSLTAFLSQGNLSGAKVTKTYWEQAMEGDETGLRPVKRLTCAAQVSISKSLLERQMTAAINGEAGGNPEIRKQLIDAQKSFLNSVGQADAATAARPVLPAVVPTSSDAVSQADASAL